MKFFIPIYALILLISCSATTTNGDVISDTSKKDTTHKTWCCIMDTTHKRITVYDTTFKHISITDTIRNKVTIFDTTHKDSVVWNIVLKDTSLIIPLYIDKRLTTYLNDSLKIRFKITYSR